MIGSPFQSLPLNVAWHVIDQLHHAVGHPERHERHDLPVVKKLLEDEFVTADHVSRQTWVDTEFLKFEYEIGKACIHRGEEQGD